MPLCGVAEAKSLAKSIAKQMQLGRIVTISLIEIQHLFTYNVMWKMVTNDEIYKH
jgi:hypothetical protein